MRKGLLRRFDRIATNRNAMVGAVVTSKTDEGPADLFF
jgi:hypothetical protein